MKNILIKVVFLLVISISTSYSQLLQSGYSVVACKPDASGVTLAIKDIRQLGTLWDTSANQGTNQAGSVTMPAIGPHGNGTWLTLDFGGNSVLSTTIDKTNGDVYVGTTILYGDVNGEINGTVAPTVYKIDGITGSVSTVATISGQLGIGYVELDKVHNQIFAIGMDDGKIYRIKLSDGSFDSYDPLNPDSGAAGLAALGERLLGVTYHPIENRVYYSVWANDRINNGNFNTVRSIGLNLDGTFKPSSDDLLVATIPTIASSADQTVLTEPFLNTIIQGQTYSGPVGDMEFNVAGNKLLIGELSFDSSIPASGAHFSRILEYQKSGSTWSLAPAVSGNVHGKYDAGEGRTRSNSRGGIAWAYHDINSTTGIANGDENFIIGTVDQVLTSPDAIWGLQFTPSSGGNHANSIDVALAYNGNAAGEKFVYGDIDIYKLQATCTKPAAGADQTVCAGTSATLTGTAPTTGTWSAQTGNPAGAILGATTTGVATVSFAITATGTYKFIYNISDNCEDTMSIVVNAKPVIADGAATICAGETVDLTSKITDYSTLLSPVWTVATADGTVVTTPTAVKPTVTTTYVLVAQNAAGCKDTANVVVTVNPKPDAGTDITMTCTAGTTASSLQLAATLTGGAWSAKAGNPTGATVDAAGLVTVTYADAKGKSFEFVYTKDGCKDTVMVTVPNCTSPCPTIVQPADTTICAGSTITLRADLTGITTEDIKFVYFNTHQTDATIIYGTPDGVLGTVTNAQLTGTKTKASLSVTIPASPTNKTYHVYAILSPSPTDASCRPFGHRHVIADPAHCPCGLPDCLGVTIKKN